jgi:hypothetical protein
MTSSGVFAVLGAWLVVALVVGATGALSRLPVPPPIIAVALTFLLLVLMRMSRATQSAARQLGARSLIAFHGIRLPIGAYFLVLEARDVLPAAFATPAGWGDVVVGLVAIVVAALCCPVRTPGRRAAVMVWNIAGLVDILGVLANGIRLFAGDPAFATPFMTLPLSLLPTFVVPLVIVSHVIVFTFSGAPSSVRR